MLEWLLSRAGLDGGFYGLLGSQRLGSRVSESLHGGMMAVVAVEIPEPQIASQAPFWNPFFKFHGYEAP